MGRAHDLKGLTLTVRRAAKPYLEPDYLNRPRKGFKLRKKFGCLLQAAGQAPKYHILQYKYVPDILEKREPHRKGHLDAIKDGVGMQHLSKLPYRVVHWTKPAVCCLCFKDQGSMLRCITAARPGEGFSPRMSSFERHVSSKHEGLEKTLQVFMSRQAIMAEFLFVATDSGWENGDRRSDCRSCGWSPPHL